MKRVRERSDGTEGERTSTNGKMCVICEHNSFHSISEFGMHEKIQKVRNGNNVSAFYYESKSGIGMLRNTP